MNATVPRLAIKKQNPGTQPEAKLIWGYTWEDTGGCQPRVNPRQVEESLHK